MVLVLVDGSFFAQDFPGVADYQYFYEGNGWASLSCPQPQFEPYTGSALCTDENWAQFLG